MCRLLTCQSAQGACQDTFLLTEADAETCFLPPTERGAGREERGLELLRKAAGAQVAR